MIPLEKQVCSLDLAKRLKELGVKQESLFYWEGLQVDVEKMRWRINKANKNHNSAKYSAFTIAELGEMLPDQVSSWRTGIEWICSHDELAETGQAVPEQRTSTEADARAKMVCYLVENGLLKF
jgi:hypothetical protein